MTDRPFSGVSNFRKTVTIDIKSLAEFRFRRLRSLTVAVVVVACIGLGTARSQNDVLTQHNDNARSGLNPNETLLTPANVNVNSFGKLFTQSVDGTIVGQPLYASRVLMNDGLMHNVVYVATQHNTVYAFDADSTQGKNASPLWSVSLNDGGSSDPVSDFGCTGTHYTEIGIMGAGVIDPAKTTLYIVAKTVTGSGQNQVRNFALHALDIRSGNERLDGPVTITATAPSSNGSGTFNPTYQMQRPALLLQNGVVYVGFGGNGCDEYAYNGWLLAYNAQTLAQEAAFLVTPDGMRASIWQGGSGPAADEGGNIYVVTANGTYDGPQGGNDFGDSVLKMRWTDNNFGVIDYFTPYNQKQLSTQDLDLGSAGALVLPDQPGLYPHELIAGGKQGTLYLINRDNEGQFDPDTDNVIQSIPRAVVSELSGVPSYFNSSVYVAGDLDYIKQFPLVNGMLTTEPASQTKVAFGGAGPASTSITANGASNGILWAIRHTNAALFAFDPANLANEFYDSFQAEQLRDKLIPVVRFVTPTISNGKVYIGGTSALAVYGLLPALTATTGNGQIGTESAVLPTPLSVVATDAYVSGPLAGVAVTCKDAGAGGLFSPSATQITDATGTAKFTYQLPRKPRVASITCGSTGFTNALFSETAVAGAPAHMTLTDGNKQTTPPKTPLADPLVVKVTDSKGYAVPRATVTFTDNGAGGIFVTNPVLTAPDGTATANYTTGPTAGPFTITASTPAVPVVNFKETVE